MQRIINTGKLPMTAINKINMANPPAQKRDTKLTIRAVYIQIRKAIASGVSCLYIMKSALNFKV